MAHPIEAWIRPARSRRHAPMPPVETMSSVRRIVRATARIVLGARLSDRAADMLARLRERRLRAATGQPNGNVAPMDLPAIDRRGDFTQSPLTMALQQASRIAAGETRLPAALRDVPGMSGRKYRALINSLIDGLPDARYLEIGSWAGSTATAALYRNRVAAVCIDNWSQFGGPRDDFRRNTGRALDEHNSLRLVEADFRRVDYRSLGSFNVFLFDGPHGEADQYDGLALADPALDRHFILIVDDWNWRAVRIGTFRAMRDRGWTVAAAIEIRSTLDNTQPASNGAASDWHNGYFIAAIDKG